MRPFGRLRNSYQEANQPAHDEVSPAVAVTAEDANFLVPEDSVAENPAQSTESALSEEYLKRYRELFTDAPKHPDAFWQAIGSSFDYMHAPAPVEILKAIFEHTGLDTKSVLADIPVNFDSVEFERRSRKSRRGAIIQSMETDMDNYPHAYDFALPEGGITDVLLVNTNPPEFIWATGPNNAAQILGELGVEQDKKDSLSSVEIDSPSEYPQFVGRLAYAGQGLGDNYIPPQLIAKSAGYSVSGASRGYRNPANIIFVASDYSGTENGCDEKGRKRVLTIFHELGAEENIGTFDLEASKQFKKQTAE